MSDPMLDVPMPSPGIIDRDFVGNQNEPIFTFAGTSMAGENLVECDQCGCLLKDSAKNKHVIHHGILNRLADYCGVQV